MSEPLNVDVGTAVATAMLDAAVTIATARQVIDADSALGYVVLAAGSAIPTVDACDGMLWARIGTAYPTDGTGQPFTAARVGHDEPAWAVTVELGTLHCHQNITEDGGWASADVETATAARDGAWRSVLLETVGYGWWPPGGMLRDAVLGQSIGAWTPIGPDGGFSGGMLVATVIVAGLWLCP